MGIDFESLRNKAQEALREHGDKLEQGLDKAGDFAKSKLTGHEGRIDEVTGKAKEFLGRFEDKPPEEKPPAE